jgi:hypothetical protein
MNPSDSYSLNPIENSYIIIECNAEKQMPENYNYLKEFMMEKRQNILKIGLINILKQIK